MIRFSFSFTRLQEGFACCWPTRPTSSSRKCPQSKDIRYYAHSLTPSITLQPAPPQDPLCVSGLGFNCQAVENCFHAHEIENEYEGCDQFHLAWYRDCMIEFCHSPAQLLADTATSYGSSDVRLHILLVAGEFKAAVEAYESQGLGAREYMCSGRCATRYNSRILLS